MISILDLGGVSFAAPFVFLSTWFGAGLVEPLRAGLAVATIVPLAAWLSRNGGMLRIGSTLFALFAAGAWSAFTMEGATGLKDDRRIVIDEVAGYLAAVATLLVARLEATWARLLVLAGAFLVLDRLKPWPLPAIEQWPGGIGVMADDIAAGMAIGLLMVAAVHLLRKRPI
jgi:phosphatidylglycerophosphatase A